MQLENQRKFVTEASDVEFLDALDPDMRKSMQTGFDSALLGIAEPDWNDLWAREAKLKKQMKLEQINKELREL